MAPDMCWPGLMGCARVASFARRGAMTERSRSATAAATFAFSRWLLGGAIFAAAALQPAIASAQQAPNPAAGLGPLTLSPNQAAEPAGDALSSQNLLQLMYQSKTAPGSGPNGAPDTVTTQTVKLRGDLSIELGSQWQLVLRGDLPYLAKIRSATAIPTARSSTGSATPTSRARSSARSMNAGRSAPAYDLSRPRAAIRSDRANGRSCRSPACATLCRK